MTMAKPHLVCAFLSLSLLVPWHPSAGQSEPERKQIPLSTSKVLMFPVPGEPQRTNSFPTAAVLSPDRRYLALLNNGYGTEESGFNESIAVLEIETGRLVDYPDARLGREARQTYFLGLTFSPDGKRLYASMASLTAAEGARPSRASG